MLERTEDYTNCLFFQFKSITNDFQYATIKKTLPTYFNFVEFNKHFKNAILFSTSLNEPTKIQTLMYIYLMIDEKYRDPLNHNLVDYKTSLLDHIDYYIRTVFYWGLDKRFSELYLFFQKKSLNNPVFTNHLISKLKGIDFYDYADLVSFLYFLCDKKNCASLTELIHSSLCGTAAPFNTSNNFIEKQHLETISKYLENFENRYLDILNKDES